MHEKIEQEEESTEATAAINEPEPEEATPEKGRYYLLERLFKFISTDEKPLNSVLSGYFTKLLTVLLNRK